MSRHVFAEVKGSMKVQTCSKHKIAKTASMVPVATSVLPQHAPTSTGIPFMPSLIAGLRGNTRESSGMVAGIYIIHKSSSGMRRRESRRESRGSKSCLDLPSKPMHWNHVLCLSAPASTSLLMSIAISLIGKGSVDSLGVEAATEKNNRECVVGCLDIVDHVVMRACNRKMAPTT